MKKIFILFGFLLILGIISSFIFIPNKLVISKVIYIESSDRIVYDYLLTNKNKSKWWPKNNVKNVNILDSTTFQYEKSEYNFLNPKFNSTDINIKNGNETFYGVLSSFTEGKNAVKLICRVDLESSNNPLNRVLNYFKAVSVKNQITFILESFGKFATNEKNIYGIEIKRTTVKDTLLLTTKESIDHSPSTIETYDLVNKLEAFATNNALKITNSPMLNVIKTFEGIYNVTVAIPVNKSTKEQSGFFVNKMIPGNILEAEVKGGKNNIDMGFIQLKNYMKDFKLSSPAMPYEMMITDRTLEKDSSKWVTKLYYPIF